jgi:phosphatidylethanolamine-binding protein (PEBP) family uncharacterized protein
LFFLLIAVISLLVQFWHWIVYDIPATCTSLPTGASVGSNGKAALPEGAKVLKNDAGFAGTFINAGLGN